jgi:hypothetical protein
MAILQGRAQADAKTRTCYGWLSLKPGLCRFPAKVRQGVIDTPSRSISPARLPPCPSFLPYSFRSGILSGPNFRRISLAYPSKEGALESSPRNADFCLLTISLMLYMRRGQSAAMKDRRERDMVNWEGREDESTSVKREVFLSKRPGKAGLCALRA